MYSAPITFHNVSHYFHDERHCFYLFYHCCVYKLFSLIDYDFFIL